MKTANAGIDYDALIQDSRVHARVYYDPAIFREDAIRAQRKHYKRLMSGAS